ncbi:MAG: pyridoxamine 5'-phosphate oxidase family protein [Pararhodobacter sp.]|nr:pyridoxamine 5'-phosphate oxidase family protein [Pararhodobacter sp.]
MTAQSFYHDGHRQLQDAFASRRLADRLEAVTLHRVFTDADRDFIESAAFFLLATADSKGQPDCSFKGGMPGFVRVTGKDELAFPDYDGNGMFRSLGNIRVNPSIGLLFSAMGDQPRRLRVNGTARIVRDDPQAATFTWAQMQVRVKVRAIFPNCPRYISGRNGTSAFAPRLGVVPPEPAWKDWDAFRDVVPPRAPVAGQEMP